MNPYSSTEDNRNYTGVCFDHAISDCQLTHKLTDLHKKAIILCTNKRYQRDVG